MSRWIRIGLRRNVLREHLAQENGAHPTDAAIDQWLRDAGFMLRGEDQWVVREEDLGHLHPSEVSTVEIEELVDGDRAAHPSRPGLSRS